MSQTKQYGLIDPKKSKIITRPSIFNESSGSDDETRKPTGISALKKKERLAQEKILAEDPTVYQYDELYDEIQTKRKDSKLARKDLDRKPKYINRLLETADRRKRENERRIERQVQKERELEGDMYKDKESFVTSAYRKKLEEMKEMEEMEKREEYLETIGDVRKQGDLSGFYRHLYAQQVNYEEEDKKKTDEADTNVEPGCSKEPVSKRRYRQRESSKSSDESEKETKLEHLPSNLDADSDFSIDSDSDDSETKQKTDVVIKDEPKDVPVIKPEADAEKPVENDEKPNGNDTVTEEKPKVPKVDIWKKRTVGAVFDEALKRYFERKAAREAASG